MLTVLCCVALIVTAVYAAIRMEAAWLTPLAPPQRRSGTPTASPDAPRLQETIPVSPGGQA